MTFAEGYYPEEEPFHDERIEDAKEAVLKVTGEQKVVTDRELKVRLEHEFFPWVVGAALSVLLKDHTLRKVGYAGRPTISMKGTDSFFCLQETNYDDIRDLVREKKRVSLDVINILTGAAPATAHAEDLFYDAFESLGFTMHGRNVSEFKGNKAHGVHGKEPPNVDFVVERDGLVYGVDVKNWIRYESVTRDEVEHKVKVALQLKTIPFIIARYVDQDTIYTKIYTRNTRFGMTYRFITLLVLSTMVLLAERAQQLLGYPMLALDVLPDYKVKWIETLHRHRLGLEEN